QAARGRDRRRRRDRAAARIATGGLRGRDRRRSPPDRKSTRLNSSHVAISYAVFCLKKKNQPLLRRACCDVGTPHAPAARRPALVAPGALRAWGQSSPATPPRSARTLRRVLGRTASQ